MAKSGIITALDIGSSKIACIIAYVDGAGKMKVAGIGHQVSEGIRAGIVIDVKKAESSILAAIHSAEKMAGETIEEANITISGGSLKSHIIQVETNVSGQEVTDRDVNHIIAQGYQHFQQEEIEIIHCLPIDYAIDDTNGIRDPRGMFGEHLSTELHVITASNTAVKNMANCLARCHLDIEDCVATPYVSGLSCLTEDEKNLGVTLLDIGAGNTAISIFADGHCIYADSIALGGTHITHDIAKGLSTSISYAERIKTLYGSVVTTDSDEREVIDIQQIDIDEDGSEFGLVGSNQSYVSKALLNTIIKPRMEEILEMARRNLTNSGLYPVSGSRLVLTGGTSQLMGVKELAGHVFDKHTRVAKPRPIEGLAESVKGPAFSAAVGTLIHASEKRSVVSGGSVSHSDKLSKQGAMNRMKQWFSENF